jgi:hypothetical protein
MEENISYTYLIGWKKHNKWYYGVRYSSKCNPNDLWKKYFTSSKVVKLFREVYGEPDVIQIRKTFNEPTKAKLWEQKVLKRMCVSSNDKWLNLREDTWNGVVMTNETRDKISKKSKGNTRTKGYTNEFRMKNGYKLIPGKPKGSKEKQETRLKKSISKTGKVTVFDKNSNTFNVSCTDEKYLSGEYTPVNKGVKWTMSEEGKKNISLSCKNREIFYCVVCDRNIKGKMNWNRHIDSTKHLSQVK